MYFLPIFVTSSSIINQHKRYKCYISSDQYGWTSVTIDPCFCFTSSDFFGISKFLFINYMTEHLWLSVGKYLFFYLKAGFQKFYWCHKKIHERIKKNTNIGIEAKKKDCFINGYWKKERSMSTLLTKKRNFVCCCSKG